MRISVAITTYNGAKYLGDQLGSFLCQTRQPDELVVCDDTSTDATLEILENFRQHAPFAVHVHRNETNLGFTKNFEKAISLCSGDIIFLADQDDVWLPEKIARIAETLDSRRDKMLVIHDAKLVDEDLTWHGATKISQVTAGWGSADPLVAGALTVLRADLRRYVLPIPADVVGHDVWIHLIGKYLGTRLVVHEPLQLLRRHSSNTSRWVGSSVDQISRFSVFLHNLSTRPATSYRDRIALNQSACRRLEGIARDASAPFARAVVEKNLRVLESERTVLCRRSELLAQGFLARRCTAVSMFIRGDYRYFNGISSFLRDFVR